MSRFSIQFLSPIFLFLLMLIDGQMSRLLLSASGGQFIIVAHLMLIFLVYTVSQHRFSYLVVLGLGLGIIYDAYYLQIYGIASLLLPLIAIFVHNIKSIVFANRVALFSTIIIVITIFDVCSTLIMLLFGISKVNILDFVVYQLAPTLLVNVLVTLALLIPLEKLYKTKNYNSNNF
ncbi:MAG: rod shape-determining protein MreD [Streptococcaceae bacterium]|nr:rod shape-determining protein MreD [Streptococcaceae bacterium]